MQGYRPVEGGEMRGFDCSDPSHGKVHFTGQDDDELVQTIKAHAATAHPDLTEGQIRGMIAGADWWKEMATSGANAGPAPSAYDGHATSRSAQELLSLRRVSDPVGG